MTARNEQLSVPIASSARSSLLLHWKQILLAFGSRRVRARIHTEDFYLFQLTLALTTRSPFSGSIVDRL
jgi:hypothetical protein